MTSPRPWKVLKRSGQHADALVLDADGRAVCVCELDDDADLLVSAVNTCQPQPRDTYPWGEEMKQYAVLGIGVEAWVDLEAAERYIVDHKLTKRGHVSLRAETLSLVMTVLRAIRLKDFAPLPEQERTQGEAHGLVRNLLSRLPYPDRLHPPEVIVEDDGDLCFDWDFGRDATVSASLSPSGHVHFAALIGDWKAHGTFVLPNWSETFNEAMTRLGLVEEGTSDPAVVTPAADTHRSSTRVPKSSSRSDLSRSDGGTQAGASACQGDCNPFVAECGARFCTMQEVNVHMREAHPSPPTPQGAEET